jgi:hypothetical protein
LADNLKTTEINMLISAKNAFDAEKTQTIKEEFEFRAAAASEDLDISGYIGQNNLNSTPMYYYRNKYMLESPAWGISVSDFQFSERIYYGRVDPAMFPVTLQGKRADNGKRTLRSLEGAESGNPLLCVDFVADAFNDMRKRFSLASISRQISPDESYLSTLVPYRAYQSFSSQYSDYKKNLYDNLVLYLAQIKVSNKIRTFNEFYPHFKSYMEHMTPEFPLTKEGFIKSKFCSPYTSGLMIDICDKDPAKDEDKMENILKSPNWKFFKNAATQYGFFIDKNIPWRLVADLGSPVMNSYLGNNDIYSDDNLAAIFETYYGRAYETSYDDFINTILSFYNSFVQKTPRYQDFDDINPDEEVKSVVCKRELKPPTPENRQALKDEPHFMYLYLYFRNLEEGSKLFESSILRISREISMMMPAIGKSRALKAANTLFTDTSQENGSVTKKNMNLK